MIGLQPLLMGIAGRPLLDLLYKLGSWVRGGLSGDSWMSSCCDCRTGFGSFGGQGYRCRSCRRLFCWKCMESTGAERSSQPVFCRFCYRAIARHVEAAEEFGERANSKMAAERLPGSPMSRLGINKPTHLAEALQSSSAGSLFCSTLRSYEDDDGDDSLRQFFSPASDVSQDNSDIDAISVSTGQEYYSFKSSPLDSPSRAGDQSDSCHYLDQEAQCNLRISGPEVEAHMGNTSNCVNDNLTVYHNHGSQKDQELLNFENNGLIWYPPPPEDEEDDLESDFFGDNDEDDDAVDSSIAFSSANFSTVIKEKPNSANKENLKSSVHSHFRALVAQLLDCEGLHVGNEDARDGWLEIVSSLAWQAATFVKPDTSKGGSMDPGDYVKVKCISSGSPSDSTLVKGVVCTKNVTHKRMVSQHKNPRVLLLGGALEYQKVPNTLASINTVLEQETDHLKRAVSKVETRRPNVLLVEKSVSSYAQEYLFTKEISLVLNVKRTILEKISRCTGAQIASSVDGLTSARLGQCEMFRIEKVSEECSPKNYPTRKSIKTLMFFEGCPRRLGCTVLLKGPCREELKKVKHVVQYASFAAYHLSLETSFLADEGASLPKVPLPPADIHEALIGACTSTSSNMLQTISDVHLEAVSCSKLVKNRSFPCLEVPSLGEKIIGVTPEREGYDSLCEHVSSCDVSGLYPMESSSGDHIVRPIPDMSLVGFESPNSGPQCKELEDVSQINARVHQGEGQKGSLALRTADDLNIMETKCFSTSDNQQSILVSFSSSCILKGTVCERSQLFRIKFYGNFDKPLGKYLREDLFDQSSCCRSCKEPAEAHVQCYTHQHGSLTISVKRLPFVKLSGERDGRIWMWHRCLRCERKDGVPPAAHRVIMSNAAWGLSFGKFLELSFSNHRRANRIASCGHSLQRDCLRFYGFGSMVAFFRYSPINILSIRLPPLVLDFSGDIQEEWVRREAAEISYKMEFLHEEISTVLSDIEQRIATSKHEPLKTSIHKQILELKDLLKRERYEYDVLLQSAPLEKIPCPQEIVDILELNRLRRCLLIDSYTWDRRLHLLDSVSKGNGSTPKNDSQHPQILTNSMLEEWRDEPFCKWSLGSAPEEMVNLSSESGISKNLLYQNEESGLKVLECESNNLVEMDISIESVEGYVGSAGLNLVSGQCYKWSENQIGSEDYSDTPSSESTSSSGPNLSDKIDLAWTGNTQTLIPSSTGNTKADSVGSLSLVGNPCYRKLISPVRVYSFDSALRFQNKVAERLSPSSHLSSIKSFDASVNPVKDPVQYLRQAHKQRSLRATRSLNSAPSHTPMFITSTSRIVSEGARLLLPHPGLDNIVIAVYENDPTSVIAYAISSQVHANFIAGKPDHNGGLSENAKISGVINQFGYNAALSNLAPRESISKFHDDLHSHYYRTDESQVLRGSIPIDPKESHFKVSFEDESSFPADKVKFSVTSYFARQFDALRKKCCPNELDFIRSLSRCKRWNAQGGKSNVYFAKSLDERFIIKQVTKTELDSFEKFAPEYFKYHLGSINSGSPTCLSKVLGIYQVTIKCLKGGREVKMDLLVMENLFYRRKISRVYDLKGSSRARYNPDTSADKVLLDLNLLETLRAKPIYLERKAKRSLERAVWNDTSFLASIDVMDYSLLVGVDEERKELVIGIIDFMRQYTWDKHLETWVKASGILGGSKNESPTVVSPMQYKKRFRKAMSSYFLTVPHPWSS